MFIGPGFFRGISADEIPIQLGTTRSHELDSFAIDYGALMTFTYGDNESSGAKSEGAFNVKGLLSGTYFFSPNGHTPYLSAGLTVGASFENEGHDYRGGGLGSRLAVGYTIGEQHHQRVHRTVGRPAFLPE